MYTTTLPSQDTNLFHPTSIPPSPLVLPPLDLSIDLSSSTLRPLLHNSPTLSLHHPQNVSDPNSMIASNSTQRISPNSSPKSSPSKSRYLTNASRLLFTAGTPPALQPLSDSNGQSQTHDRTSPLGAPRKRRSTFGARYSPPPVASASSQKSPPAIPNLPNSSHHGSSTTTEQPGSSIRSDYFGGRAPSIPINVDPSFYNSSGATPVSQSSGAGHRPLIPTAKSIDIITRQPPRSTGHSRSANSSVNHKVMMAATDRTIPSIPLTRPSTSRSISAEKRPSTTESARSSAGRMSQKDRDKDRKAILSKALQKAHQAVLLDNAHNVEGSIEAYSEACELLHQVLIRSTADEERKKLDQIRETYSNRVQELLQNNKDTQDTAEKSLPARPTSDEAITPEENIPAPESERAKAVEPVVVSLKENSRPTTANDSQSQNGGPSGLPPPSPAKQPPNNNLRVPGPQYAVLSSPMDPNYVPPPLSPRRLPKEQSTEREAEQARVPDSAMYPNARYMPWGQADSGSSSASSSVESLIEFNSKITAVPQIDLSHEEFDAALDAAIEAAYDDGLEPYDYLGSDSKQDNSYPSSQYTNRRQTSGSDPYDDKGIFSDGSNDQQLEGFDFGLQGKNAPRQSDSSAYSGSTYHSSISSSRATASSLATVAEGTDPSYLAGGKLLGSLPRLSEEHAHSDSPNTSRPGSRGQLAKSNSGSVRSRRLSGQNAKQLKIETQPMPKQAPTFNKIQEETASGLRFAGLSQTSQQTFNGAPHLPPIPNSAGSRPLLSPAETAVTISPATPGLPPSINEEGNSPGGYRIPNRPVYLKKNKSSLSLKQRALSVSSPDGSDGSVATPMSTVSLSRKITNTTHPSLPTPTFVGTPGEGSHAGTHIFKTDLHSPTTPGFPNTLRDDGPVNLEKCPEQVFLRPFWLLRCVYQTIANPAGGYISTKLYVTPAVWNTKGVKLKNIEDKIAACEALTAALLRLKAVDSYDAAAVLEEMQSLENVLDSSQFTLAKKLGSDVGVQGTSAFLKDAPAETNTTSNGVPASAGAENPYGSLNSRSSSKTYLSWRKLRGKNGPPPVNGAAKDFSSKDVKAAAGDAGSAPRMASLPMTKEIVLGERFGRKRDLSVLNDIVGPNAAYMASLARLCDAVQVVDQIARQVEDPGLKGSSPTHVGLDLCTRHASEFFGFYVCRWVMADLGILLDKFVKRSTEWVLT